MWTQTLTMALLAGRAIAEVLPNTDAPLEAVAMDAELIEPDAGPQALDLAPAPAPEVEREKPEFVKRDPNNPWPNCRQNLMGPGNNATHSLMDILDSGELETRNRGMPPRFLDIVNMVDEPTMALLEGFNLTGSGYTLVVPEDETLVFNVSTGEQERVNVYELYEVPEMLTQPLATAIVRAHLIPGTIGWLDLQQRLRGNGTATYTSLEGFEWKVRYEGEDVGGEFPVVIDKQNRTGLGYFELQVDVSVAPPSDCPNTVWIVDGFVVGENDLGPILDPAAAAAAPGPGALPGGTATDESIIPETGTEPGAAGAADGAQPLNPGQPPAPGEEAADGAASLLGAAAAGGAALLALLL